MVGRFKGNIGLHQGVACFLISSIIELAIFVASIVQVHEEGWMSGMRESGSINKKED